MQISTMDFSLFGMMVLQSPPSTTDVAMVLWRKLFCRVKSSVIPSLPIALFLNGISLKSTVLEYQNAVGVLVRQVRRETKITTTPKLAEYLRNLRLSSSVTDMVQKREAGLLHPPKTKRKKVPVLMVGSSKGTGLEFLGGKK